MFTVKSIFPAKDPKNLLNLAENSVRWQHYLHSVDTSKYTMSCQRARFHIKHITMDTSPKQTHPSKL